MAVTQINWHSLLNFSEFDFQPAPPAKLTIDDNLVLSLAILTAATRGERLILRCNSAGALLTGNAWDNFAVVETDELYPESGTTDSFTATIVNLGVLISTAAQLVQASIVRISGGDTEIIYIPPYTMYFFPHKTYSITLAVVPDPNGTASYVGITAFI